ncbi:MAG: DUF885 domain-containing protein [Kangiellaceae bacterium]|jgi:uncharacterized protein (DUF885 family)|nr:DUF885 domain-containing protein [Kangiellaceae bacterium]
MIKKIILWLLAIIVAVLALGATFVWYNLTFKPLTINIFFNRAIYEMVKDSPETLSSLHVLEGIGIKGHQSKLDNADPSETDKTFAMVKEYREVLLSYEDADLTNDEKLSKEIMLYLMDYAVELEPYRFYNYPVNQLFGAQSNFPSFMDGQHQVNDVRDAEDYVKRLHAVKLKFEQIGKGLAIREQNDIIPPQFVIDRVLTEMNEFVATAPEENILYTSLKAKMEKAQLPPAEIDRILAETKDAIVESVHPAYDEFIQYFSSLGDKATTDDGFWKLPNGDTAYKMALKLFTTTDYTPEQIHNIGLREVDRIQAEMVAILAGEGFDTSDGFTSSMKLLSEDPRFYYPDTDEGREQILKDYQAIIDEINGGLDDAFRVRPAADVVVKRIPLFKEKTSPGAYYQQPALDGSRPGTFYANLYDIKATPKYGMRTLAYHEAVPGHHFQIAIAQELKDVPIFRKFAPFTAYVEGWALYSEQVAWELGFQNNPFDNIGRLQAELFRAVRLVVDTGIHHKRWTREQAIEYMLNNTGMAESDVISEIERYIVMPGQATAYKVGMIKILELREKAKSALGDKFDLRDFHDVVLKNGAVPLSILEKIIDKYIAETSA